MTTTNAVPARTPAMPDQRVIDWRKAGRHLPTALRDFHDQKDVFNLVHHMTREPGPEQLIRHPTWIEGQVYVIDTFLWCMARHGYTLQRSRAGLPFDDLHQNIASMREQMRDQFASILSDQAGITTTSKEP